jgi:hypothetical protein
MELRWSYIACSMRCGESINAEIITALISWTLLLTSFMRPRTFHAGGTRGALSQPKSGGISSAYSWYRRGDASWTTMCQGIVIEFDSK